MEHSPSTAARCRQKCRSIKKEIQTKGKRKRTWLLNLSALVFDVFLIAHLYRGSNICQIVAVEPNRARCPRLTVGWLFTRIIALHRADRATQRRRRRLLGLNLIQRAARRIFTGARPKTIRHLDCSSARVARPPATLSDDPDVLYATQGVADRLRQRRRLFDKISTTAIDFLIDILLSRVGGATGRPPRFIVIHRW